jgi:hypothetical protein
MKKMNSEATMPKLKPPASVLAKAAAPPGGPPAGRQLRARHLHEQRREVAHDEHGAAHPRHQLRERDRTHAEHLAASRMSGLTLATTTSATRVVFSSITPRRMICRRR